jgi:ribose/xylose/arabinose/galactoside ABC-type transport system permease subunit
MNAAPESGMLRIVRQREFGLAVLIALITLVVGRVDAGFVSLENLRDLLVRCAPSAIVACGVMLVVVTGEIDISVSA